MSVSALPRPNPRRPDWRKAGLATASVAINTALIAALSLTALGIEGRDIVAAPPPIYLDIEPRPLLPDERPRVPTVTRPEVAPVAAAASNASPAPSVRAPETEALPRPAPLRPRLAAPAPPGAPPPADVWRVDPANRSGAMARSLRQGLPGCASPDLLNDAERRHCRDEFARRGENAAPITGSGNPQRDAAFAREGARRLAEWEAKRRPLSGGVGVVGPADCVGSNFGTGCAGAQLNPSLAPDSSRNVQTRRDGHRAGGVPITPGASAPMERWKD
ncbi:hypothetical protein [Brevundimonas mediterranea]|uniref:Uncharacterized protein n=1 Tax=Brevundimonas mediterranea TaxID=74329 RepID=A0A7W6A4Y8_9CAUL|nr:hypothetical protein [Brevundimonas mediterranea]MBB3870788.1 hypothetical protein [Brevundimonas mediterranea]